MKSLLFLFILCTLFGCDWAATKAKNTVNKTGEVVGKAGSEFADGVKKGVLETFEDKASLSPGLAANGLQLGKVLNASKDSMKKLSAYFIFGKDFSGRVTAIVYDDKGVEYGRSSAQISGRAGQAAYTDFLFDERTDFGYRGRIEFQ